MGIFSKIFKKSQKSEPSKNDKKDEINNRGINYGAIIGQKPGYFREDGVWEIELECISEHVPYVGFTWGCGLREPISEYDIDGKCGIFTWSCRLCGKCHAISPCIEIPEVVKGRIQYRTALKERKNPVIIDIREYKRKKSKRENTAKKSND